jgi:hypothetical protein
MKLTYRNILERIPPCFYKASYIVDLHRLYYKSWMNFRTQADVDTCKEQDNNIKEFARKIVRRDLFNEIVNTAPTEIIEETVDYGIKLSAMAVIMSEKEFNDVVIQAYEQGQKDGYIYHK